MTFFSGDFGCHERRGEEEESWGGVGVASEGDDEMGKTSCRLCVTGCSFRGIHVEVL